LGHKQIRRVVVFVVGMTVLLLGGALLVLPGPAILVIPAGLAILGLEFRWARRWMRRARAVLKSGETRFFRRGPASNHGKGSGLSAANGLKASAAGTLPNRAAAEAQASKDVAAAVK
jgi:hypothetical protein